MRSGQIFHTRPRKDTGIGKTRQRHRIKLKVYLKNSQIHLVLYLYLVPSSSLTSLFPKNTEMGRGEVPSKVSGLRQSLYRTVKSPATFHCSDSEHQHPEKNSQIGDYFLRMLPQRRYQPTVIFGESQQKTNWVLTVCLSEDHQ